MKDLIEYTSYANNTLRSSVIEGRLNQQSCYMVGPIDKCNNFGRQWREEMTIFLKSLGVHAIDPGKKPIKCDLDAAGEDADAVIRRNKLIENGEYDTLARGMKLIRNCDLRFVDKGDFIVVNYDLDIRMVGTYEEIYLANREKKPIILMCPQGKRAISPWLFAALKHELFFESWDQVKEYLLHIHLAEEIDTLNGRWLFFEYERPDQTPKVVKKEGPYQGIQPLHSANPLRGQQDFLVLPKEDALLKDQVFNEQGKKKEMGFDLGPGDYR